MPATIFRLKKMYVINGGTVMSRTAVNSRFYCVMNLALEVEKRQLDGGVLVPGRKYSAC